MSDSFQDARKIAFDWYQVNALRTAAVNGTYPEKWYLALGLAGESGEVTEIIKKHYRHGKELNTEHLREELGDVLWYVTVLAASNGIDLYEVAEANIEKLRKRYPEGFVQRG